MEPSRLELSRLYARFSFGPRPGEFNQALKVGFTSTAQYILDVSSRNSNDVVVQNPNVDDVGVRPSPSNISATKTFNTLVKNQNDNLVLWWLDRMALTNNPFLERMIWFWHGHWATSIDKVNFALPMFNQLQTIRATALGNFQEMARQMFRDGALQIWLDGNDNVKGAPNENLSREFMELFTVGVNNYTEDDVKSLAKAFTGFQVNRTTGVISFNPTRHFTDPITFFDSKINSDPVEAINVLTARPDNSYFIATRLWFRFISSNLEMDKKFGIQEGYRNRDISSTMKALVMNGALSVPEHTIVRQPVEWFIAICRAFSLQPSKLIPRTLSISYLSKLAQVPFYPPNVGGWPTDEAWLSAASAQFRIAFASALAKQVDLSPIAAIEPLKRVSYIKDLLGIFNFSTRTFTALTNAKDDLPQFFTLVVCSPEFIVNA